MTYFTLSLTRPCFAREPDPCEACDSWRNNLPQGTAIFRRATAERCTGDPLRVVRECAECGERWFEMAKVRER